MVSGSIQLGLRQPPGHVSIMPPLWKYAQHRFLQSLHLYEVSPLWSDTQGRKQSCNHCLISHFPSLPQLRVAAAWQLQEREAGSQKHHYQIGKERLLAGFEAHYTAARQATFSISTFFFLSRRTWADEGTTAPSTTQDKSWFITKVALFLLIRCYGLGFGWLGFCFGLGFFFSLRNSIFDTKHILQERSVPGIPVAYFPLWKSVLSLRGWIQAASAFPTEITGRGTSYDTVTNLKRMRVT